MMIIAILYIDAMTVVNANDANGTGDNNNDAISKFHIGSKI